MHVITVIGLPVYFHYCGGELEEVSVLMKSNNCCGEEEDESTMEPGCCENESIVLRFDDDFLTKKQADIKSSDLFSTLFFVKVSFLQASTILNKEASVLRTIYPPPDSESSSIIKTTFLRI